VIQTIINGLTLPKTYFHSQNLVDMAHGLHIFDILPLVFQTPLHTRLCYLLELPVVLSVQAGHR
jgi:hypothetical protein